jgi:hypothetical protein
MFHVAEQGHVVNIIPPQDINGAGANSDVFSMAGYAHASIVLTLGTTGAASTVTLLECDDFVPSNTTAIGFDYYAETTAAGDTLGSKTTATASGFATSTNDNITYVIEVNADELSDGYPCLQLSMTDPTAATVVSAVAILSGGRHQPGGTAIA